MAILANAAAGLAALAAWQRAELRGLGLWVATALAEAAILLQVTTGAILESSERHRVDRFHMFYGFVAFVTVGIVFASRDQLRPRREMVYGFVGLFLAGVGIRAVQVIA
ncbi:MAG: hypothetical protein M3357_18845 [Actinomycetota bacterium]|nr:hypothetical protein [Actinomycetota bacterium]